ncbi:oligosaccharide flippase family protein [Hydrogenophaga sp. RWCD_12]|uniref:oligosaccharide flippase family protein n=1 Tax=Hydrogenophaga sp. RWCD_12 TaxID=3391190 RepID=UPI0039853842
MPAMIRRLRDFLAKPGLGPKLVKAVVGSAGLRLAGMFFGFLVGVQLARGLGVEGYGIYGLAMSIIALMSVVTEFGLPQLLTREVAAAQVKGDWGKVRGVLQWSARTVLLFSALTFVGCVVWLLATGKRLSDPLSVTLMAGLPLVALVSQGKLRCAALRGLQQIVKSQVPETLLRPASFSILLFAAVLVTPLFPAMAMGLGVVAAGISLLFSASMLRKSSPAEMRNAPVVLDVKQWRSSALPMALTEGMRVFQAHLAVLMLGALSTVSMVGLFRVASSMAVLIAFPLSLFTVVSASVIARLHAQEDHERLQKLLSWLSLGMTASTFGLSLPFLLAGRPLLGMTFGQDFASSNSILLVLCLSNVLSGFFGTNAVLLNMTGHHVRVMRASWVSLAVIVVACPILVMWMGGIGAALASTIATLVWNIIMWRDALELLNLDASFIPLLKRSMGKRNGE